ncbi:hypothetical protein TraAM80_04225 [Trypanosoma rangeli]|uniref:Transmembrane protein n=1 Tax=Trypanosoma rangeli TaxID=5698 RepID=A0A3R7NFU6_TRYRA|nr:uncharacterized protein TraAM80_04225 [Trypanosoma rangeli]RNF05926.1 hypothetical protein TraAM80_04225 [Trypanosoma rangeli]|eukprot:RNF05926.1 hypothetical protein TraAM80_04225 [Trypanosoma rangeli]
MPRQPTQVPSRAFLHHTSDLSSNSFSSCASSGGYYIRNKCGSDWIQCSEHAQHEQKGLEPEERQQQKILHGDEEESGKRTERMLSLSMPRIFSLDASFSLETEKTVVRAEDKAKEKDVSLNADIATSAQQSLTKLWETTQAKRSSGSSNGFSARPTFGFSLSVRSDLTCVELPPFEMPAFISLDFSEKPTHNHEVALEADEDLRDKKRREIQICLVPKQELKLRTSLDAGCGGARASFQFPPSLDDAEAQLGRVKPICRPFIFFILIGLLLPFAAQELIVVVNHFATSGPMVCGGKEIDCSLADTIVFALTYGIHLYIPFSFFAPTLFFLAYDVVVRKEQEQESRSRMACYAVPDDTTSLACTHTLTCVNDQFIPSHCENTRAFDEQSHASQLQWDLPPCVGVLRRGAVFWVIVLARFVCLVTVDIHLPFVTKIPAALWGPMRLVALALPLTIYSLYETRPFFAVPYVLMDAFSLFFQLILGNNGIQIQTRCMAGPMLLVLFERCFWYVSAAAMPKEVPVGIKMVVSSTFTALYFLLLLALSIPVDIRNSFYVTIVMAVQIFFWELLFNVRLLEVVACRLYAFFMKFVFRRTFKVSQVQAADPTNISTQVRWPTLLISTVAIAPFFQYHQWPRFIPHSDERGSVSEVFHVYVATFFVVIGVIILATIISLFIRWKHQLLRMPLIMEDWFLLLIWGWYVFSSVPLALAAVV